MSDESCNTKEGIAARIGTYDELFGVLQERYRLDISGGELRFLNPFVVLGRYHTDQFGQLTRLSRNVFSDADRASMPPVMDADEFKILLAQRGLQRWAEKRGSSRFGLPRPSTVCAGCGGTWTIETCHDIECEGAEYDQELDLTPYAGKTLREAQEELDALTDGERSIAKESVYNRTANYENAESAESKDPGDPISREYVVREGDKVWVFVYRFYHSSCFAQHQAKEKENELEAMRRYHEQMLETMGGFEDVKVAPAGVPEHVVTAFVAEDPDLEEGFANNTEPGMYWDVSTRQGDFGIVQMPFPAFDLTKTGLKVGDVSSVYASADMTLFDWLIPIADEPENTMQLLCLALLKRPAAAR